MSTLAEWQRLMLEFLVNPAFCKSLIGRVSPRVQCSSLRARKCLRLKSRPNLTTLSVKLSLSTNSQRINSDKDNTKLLKTQQQMMS